MTYYVTDERIISTATQNLMIHSYIHASWHVDQKLVNHGESKITELEIQLSTVCFTLGQAVIHTSVQSHIIKENTMSV